jgi:hypothetical protein
MPPNQASFAKKEDGIPISASFRERPQRVRSRKHSSKSPRDSKRPEAAGKSAIGTDYFALSSTVRNPFAIALPVSAIKMANGTVSSPIKNGDRVLNISSTTASAGNPQSLANHKISSTQETAAMTMPTTTNEVPGSCLLWLEAFMRNIGFASRAVAA